MNWNACVHPGPLRIAIACVLLACLGALPLHAQSETSAATNTPSIHFQAVDIFIDTHERPLAAYQLEFAVTNGAAKIVGIEGGEPAAFAEPPFYDSQAMQHERVIIAAFSTNAPAQLPAGKIRVATIHLQTIGAGNSIRFLDRAIDLKLQAAADPDGNKLPAEARMEERKAK